MKEPSFTSKAEHRDSNLSRRNFITGAVLYGGAAVVGAELLDDYNKSNLPEEEVAIPEESVPVPESIEVEPKLTSESFDRWKKGYQAWWVMPYNSVVFVDENNEPVAPPIAFQDFIVPRSKVEDGKEVIENYAMTPGKKDQDGFLTEGLAKEWLGYIKPLVVKKYKVASDELTVKHITPEFTEALKSGDEVLVAGIRSGEINRVLDVMHHYADVSASVDDQRDRITFIEEELEFTESGITPLMATELRSLVPSLCAKESLFKDRKPNGKGARGIAQFKPSVWNDLGIGEYGDSQPFTRQVEAIGLQFGQIHRELVMNERVNEMIAQIEALFVSRESFEKYFWVPLMINAYNAGAGRMKEVIIAFMENHSIDDLRNQYTPVDGMDLFFAMSKSAVRNGVGGYGDDASQYVGYIYALRDVLQAEKREREIQLASSE